MKNLLFIILFLGLITNLYGQSEIKSIEGYLFYNQNNMNNNSGGTLSENIIDNDNFSLYNVIIGEGSAKSSSSNTIIIVKLVNNVITEADNNSIKLTVFDENNNIVFRQEQHYSILESNNIYFAPFLLYGTGCEALKLRAEIIDKTNNKVLSVLEKSIDFRCGE